MTQLIKDWPDALTASQAETALCVFEYLMDRQSKHPFADMFDDIGWAQMRLNAIVTAVWIDRLIGGMEFEEAHDWEIVPFLLGLFNWDAWAECAYGKFEGAFPDTDTARLLLTSTFDPTNR